MRHDFRINRFLLLLDRAIGRLIAAGLSLAIPLSALLFLQWPLRDGLGRFSREANDLGQIVFAFYVAWALTYATRQGTHLAADSMAQRQAASTRRYLQRVAAMIVLLPWAAFILYAAWPGIAQSVMQWESFPDTFSPGYWLIKLAMGLLAALVFLQALVDLMIRREK